MTGLKLRFDIITMFPTMFPAVCQSGVIGRAVEHGLISIQPHQLRDYVHGNHHLVDDQPYGGGPGMVMRAQPIFDAVEDVTSRYGPHRKILLTPQGHTFDQHTALELTAPTGADEQQRILLLCGRYEGVDERVRDLFDDEISIGDYVLSGGEVAALTIIDAVGRLIPGVLGSDQSTVEESFSSGMLEYPQYTRPEVFRGKHVPPVLLSGNHREIERWRHAQAEQRTRQRRPDLLGEDSDQTSRKGSD
ncbi:MAG: tRNA (guanosine(37)-N1)-methyltransferase TrmD [Candidatus Binatia bacterium]